MSRKYNKVIVMGRFEPVHIGHIHLLKEAEKLGDEIIILCGSRNRSRSVKNPWRLEERQIMLTLAIEELIPALKSRVRIAGIADFSYNDQHWASEVAMQVARMTYTGIDHSKGAFRSASSIALVGHKKDPSSFYLDMFPQWKYEEVAPLELLNATDIRKSYFSQSTDSFLHSFLMSVPEVVLNYLCDWKNTEHYLRLVEEFKSIKKDNIKYAQAPYPECFNMVTTDAVVVESGHVLMVKRGGKVGNGLWALPGGFLNNDERIIDGAIRELQEETKIDCPAKILYGNCKGRNVFDALGRDPRGRIITHGFLFELPSQAKGLSKVKGSDDAQDARWFPLYQLEQMSEAGEIYADHADIIFNLTGKV